MNKNYTTSVSVPVEFVYDQSEFIRVAEPSEFFEAKVSGMGWDLLQANLGYDIEPIKVDVKWGGPTKEINATELMQETSENLQDFKVNYVYKKRLFTGLEPKIEKHIDFFIDKNYIPVDGLTKVIGSATFEPAYLDVSGPASVLGADSIQLSDFTNIQILDTLFTAQVDIAANFNEFCSMKSTKIKVEIPIVKYHEIRQTVKLKIPRLFGRDASFDFTEVRVQYLKPTTADSFDFGNDFFYIDIPTINRADSTIEIGRGACDLKDFDFAPKKVKFIGFQ